VGGVWKRPGVGIARTWWLQRMMATYSRVKGFAVWFTRLLCLFGMHGQIASTPRSSTRTGSHCILG
jgi:hypothetical protein